MLKRFFKVVSKDHGSESESIQKLEQDYKKDQQLSMSWLSEP